ncbi:hypothetical protein RBG61_04100 [Paludicola sp. MB14-C6]|uniref:hypothetical protein n=1 Tax=Paludihabitans sp. MB14-C6 TaxID=3070656 RepID=UPI0027DCA4D8|nr:hypothetical protein [Paludicola sp. MB14-C6]WMJ23856.1 hypothetical protein RBG61_04100 [Paludicola sp. MB14-C6]
MKRILLTIILLTSIILTGCSSNSMSKSTKADLPKNPTVKHIALTKEEKEIATATCNTLEKFIIKKDKVYDIEVSYYHNGKIIPQTALLGVDSKGKDLPVIISKEILPDNKKELWHIGADGGSSFYLDFLPIEGKCATLSGVTYEAFNLEKGKEYLLYYVAYKKGNSIRSGYPIFLNWDSTDNKLEPLKEFEYVILVTIKLSNTPGYK